jgi:DNA topoisomerase-1
MQIRTGRYGKFLACTDYPECKTSRPILIKLGQNCPKCLEGELVEKKGRSGRPFFGCARYPACDWVSFARPLPDPCEVCGKLRIPLSGDKVHCMGCDGELPVRPRKTNADGTPVTAARGRGAAGRKPAGGRTAAASTTGRTKTATTRTAAAKAPAKKTAAAKTTTTRTAAASKRTAAAKAVANGTVSADDMVAVNGTAIAENGTTADVSGTKRAAKAPAVGRAAKSGTAAKNGTAAKAPARARSTTSTTRTKRAS